MLNESLFDGVAEYVLESVYLSGFIQHDTRLVSSTPKLFTPVPESTYLSSDVAKDELHKAGG